MAFNGFANVNIAPSAIARIKALASTNLTLVAAKPVTLTGFVLVNTTATILYVKLYDKATAPVLATDVPAFTLPVPANGAIALPFDVDLNAGFAYAITNLVADTDATGVAANAVHGFIAYK